MGAVKEMIKRWLDIKPAENQRITIDADMSHQDACFEYSLWYRGSASELEFCTKFPILKWTRTI